MTRARILVVDDVDLFRTGLSAALGAAGFEICGEAADAEGAVSAAESFLPDVVVLVDIDPELSVRRIQARGGGGQDLFENIENLHRVRRVFNSINEPHILKLDGTRPPTELHAQVLARLQRGPLATVLAER